jgi:PEP-CTERM motif
MSIRKFFCIPAMVLMPLLAQAGTVSIIQGVAGDNTLLPASSPSPGFSTVINFANLESQIVALGSAAAANCDNNGLGCPTFNPSQYASPQGVTISSPDGLIIFPFSDQTAGGIELFDPGATSPATCIPNQTCDGTANITISLAGGVNALAVGISDFDDPVDVTLSVLGASGVIFSDTIDPTSAIEAATATTGQTYFVAEDTTPDITGIEITQSLPTGGSGLALAEVELTPEPSTFMLLIGGGLAMIGAARLRKKA